MEHFGGGRDNILPTWGPKSAFRLIKSVGTVYLENPFMSPGPLKQVVDLMRAIVFCLLD